VRRLRDADVALLFYAGHGLSFEGENYLVPVDASAQDVMDIRFGMQPIRTITDEMARSARVNLVLLDACRDNPLARGLSRSLGGATRSSAIKRGLSRLEQIGRQSYIMLATKDGEVAADGSGDHSPFSQALLDNIEMKDMEISELARRVRKEVREATDERQVPLTINSLEDAFYFSPSKDATSAAPPLVDRRNDPEEERRRDQVFWESIKDLDSIEMYHTYIERFPKGQFVEIAEAKIEQIKAKSKKPSDDVKAQPPADDADKAYREAVADGGDAKLRAFANAYPNHPRAAQIKLMLDERDSWRQAEAADTREAYERHLMLYPQGPYAMAAKDRISALVTRALPSPPPADRSSTPQPPSYTPTYTPRESYAPSFNCNENTGVAEQAVCGNQRLSQLDVEVAKLYALLRGRLSTQQGNSLRNSQRDWIKQRNACGANIPCIEDSYLRRLQQLRAGFG